MDGKPQVLFLCTGNAGRSQMAEAMLRAAAGADCGVQSAGVEPWPDLHPTARKLMAERGLSMEGQRPKHVDTFRETPFDYVVTIGEQALAESGELRGNPRRIHWALGDPADADGTPDAESVFRGALARIEEGLPELLATVRRCRTAREMHLKPAISTMVSRPETFDPELHLPLMAEAGFRIIELCPFAGDCGEKDFDWQDGAKVAALGRTAAELGIAVWSVHAPAACSGLGALDDAERRQTVETIGCVMELAVELGAAFVPVHAGLSPDRLAAGTHSAEALRVGLDELCARALALPCVPVWENAPAGWVQIEPEQIVAMVRAFPPEGLGFVCDTSHANLGGDIGGYLPAMGLQLRTWHLSDNYGGDDDHNRPGLGTVDWRQVGDVGAAAGYMGPLVLEVHRHGVELAPFLRRAHEEALRIASQWGCSAAS